MGANRPITVRVSEARLRKLMRARRLGTHSQLINTLLAEEEERLSSHAVLRRASRGLSPREIKSLFDALTAGGRRGAVADLLAGRR